MAQPSRQARWYERNKEKIVAKKRAEYLKTHPHASPYKPVVIAPKKSEIDRMLDKMEEQRRNRW